MTAEEDAEITRRAAEAGLSVSAWVRSRLLGPAEVLAAAVTTGDKLESPAAATRRKSSLCTACARTGRARWNCRACAAPQPA